MFLALAFSTSALGMATRTQSLQSIEDQSKHQTISENCQSSPTNAATGQCIDLGDIAKDCAVGCLLSMLPIPDPCGKFGKLISTIVGAGTGLANSFEADTLVHTRVLTDSGYQARLKLIKDIQIGDEVLAWDELQAHDNAALAMDGQAQHTLQAAYQQRNEQNSLNSKNNAAEANLTSKSASNPSKCCSSSYENNSESIDTNHPSIRAASKPTSAQRYEKVTDIASSFKAQTLLHLTLDNGQTIQATAGHPFKTSEGWRDAVMLKKGGKLLLGGGDADAEADANSAERFGTITDIREEVKTTAVFNLEVANLHTFFVGEEGLAVHNGGGAHVPCGSSRGAFRQAKRDAGIPTSQTHRTHSNGQGDRNGGRATDFGFDGNKAVQHHPDGHNFPDGNRPNNGSDRPHYNNHQPPGVPGGTKNHYSY